MAALCVLTPPFQFPPPHQSSLSIAVSVLLLPSSSSSSTSSYPSPHFNPIHSQHCRDYYRPDKNAAADLGNPLQSNAPMMPVAIQNLYHLAVTLSLGSPVYQSSPLLLRLLLQSRLVS